MVKISGVVIAKNEETNIRECLESLRFADEIVVIDDNSTDNTVAICREYTDKIYSHTFAGWVKQKNFAISKAGNDWILSIDADERISGELKHEIMRITDEEFIRSAGFEIPIRPYYMGKWISYSNWYPGYKVRFFNRTCCRWAGDFSHEYVEANGPTGRLTGDILHLAFLTFSDHLRKVEYYTTYSSRELAARGTRFSVTQLVFRPVFSFIKHFLLKQGWRDGLQGLTISSVSAFSVFAKYVKLFELNRQKSFTTQDE